MQTPPRVSLEQWRTLVAVVEEGGYERAAEALNKSQSTVTYAIKRLESALDLRAFELKGRRSALTPTGTLLYRQARQLLADADRLERMAGNVSSGWEAQIVLTADVIFPVWLLLTCLDRFGEESPHTHIELIESVMGGAREDLLSGRADLAISHDVPPGFLGEPLLTLRFVAVAHPEHPLHRLGRKLTARDLRQHRHLVVRDSARQRSADTALAARARWTVSNMATSIGAACRGYGYSWDPEYKIRDELAQGVLAPLPLERGARRLVTVYLTVADAEGSGPGVARLAEIIRDAAAELADTDLPAG